MILIHYGAHRLFSVPDRTEWSFGHSARANVKLHFSHCLCSLCSNSQRMTEKTIERKPNFLLILLCVILKITLSDLSRKYLNVKQQQLRDVAYEFIIMLFLCQEGIIVPVLSVCLSVPCMSKLSVRVHNSLGRVLIHVGPY